MAQGLQVVMLSSGQYDPGTLEPTVSGEAGKLYFVPTGEADEEDAYVEWMWVSGAWERVGMSNATIEAVTTDQVDAVVADGAPQGEQVLNLTGLSYLWAKLKAAFSAIGHKHSATDVTSGTLPIARGGTGTASLSSEAGNGGFVAASRGNPTLFAETGTGAAYADKDGTHVGTLPVSLGGTGSTSASAALTALGAASASDLDDVRDSLSQYVKPSRKVTDPLLISLSNPSDPANQPSKIVADAAPLDDYQNLPAAWTSGPVFAYRIVQLLSSNHAAVWLFETFPQRRIWANFYNLTKWSGWEQV